MNPIKWLWRTTPESPTIEPAPAEEEKALISNAKHLLEPVGLWDEGLFKAIGENDELLKVFIPLFESLVEMKGDFENPEKRDLMMKLAAQASSIMDLSTSEETFSAYRQAKELLDLLTFRSPYLKENLMASLKLAGGENLEIPETEAHGELESYYHSEGFQKPHSTQPFWTRVEIRKPSIDLSSSKGKEKTDEEPDFSITLYLAIPGLLETSVCLSIPRDEDIPPEALCRAIAMALEGTLDEAMDDRLKLSAKHLAKDLEEKIADLTVLSLMEPPHTSEAMRKRVGFLKTELWQKLENFEKFLTIFKEKGMGEIALPPEELHQMKEVIGEQNDLRILVPLRNYLDTTLFAGQKIREHLAEEFPLDISDWNVIDALEMSRELLSQLDNLTDIDRERLEYLEQSISHFTGALIVQWIFDPGVYQAYQTGLTLDEILPSRGVIEKSDGSMKALINEFSSYNRSINSISDYKQFQLLDQTRLMELISRVQEEEKLDPELVHLVDRISELTALKTSLSLKRIDRFKQALTNLEVFAPLTKADRELFKTIYATLTQTKKEEFVQALNRMSLIHEEIKTALLETGKLPDHFHSELEPAAEASMMKVIEGDVPPQMIQLMVQYVINQLVFGNLQLLSDSFDAYGLNLPLYQELYGEPTGRTERIFRSAEVPYSDPETVQKDLGYYTVYERHNPERILLSKADWDPDISNQKYICHFGRASFDDVKKTWGPIREMDIKFDLSSLSLDSRERTEAYFKMMKVCIGDKRKRAVANIKSEGKSAELFTEDEFNFLIDHIYIFLDEVVLPAMYKTHFALLYPDEDFGVKKVLPH